MEDPPIYREVAEACAADRYPMRSSSPTAGRHHWRREVPTTTDPYGDIPDPRR